MNGATAVQKIPDETPPKKAATNGSVAAAAEQAPPSADTPKTPEPVSDVVPPTPSDTSKDTETASVTLRYMSGWEAPVLHASVCGQEWATWTLEREDGVLSWSALTDSVEDGVPLVEFVITDGEGDWDKPVTGENYKVFENGTFELSMGEITKV
eukprot:TRINITY_DN35516_c0_g1_i2.p3 TRINITY_DN35516_c0_g1~~TRINITY_DN35516_c0_g1_i2.p3  ORF type:complete len:154 (-),score=29.55 TRINITY_DN35516_c0_g1_i2:487-948(-)